MNLPLRLIELRKREKYTQENIAEKLNIGRTTYNGYEKGIITPPVEKLNKLAEIYGVTTDYLIGKTDDIKLSGKDELDIAKQMEKLVSYATQLDELTFNGEPMDKQSRELLINSLQHTLEMGKIIAKEKYTPNKYRKDDFK